MKNLVFESLDELFEAKVCEKTGDDKAKPEDVKKTHAKVEKTKAQKQPETKNDKAKQSIAGLKDQLAKAKKPGAFKTVLQKNAKIKEIQAKIDAWEKKLS